MAGMMEISSRLCVFSTLGTKSALIPSILQALAFPLIAMIQDKFLIEFAQVGHQPNTSGTLWIAATKASISSRVL
jgi:hypothetical protein